MSNKAKVTYVNNLPDLITRRDYEAADNQKVIRFRLTVNDDGLEILGDSPYPHLLDDLLNALGPEAIEKVLCG